MNISALIGLLGPLVGLVRGLPQLITLLHAKKASTKSAVLGPTPLILMNI